VDASFGNFTSHHLNNIFEHFPMYTFECKMNDDELILFAMDKKGMKEQM
jgi:hypothetical protein